MTSQRNDLNAQQATLIDVIKTIISKKELSPQIKENLTTLAHEFSHDVEQVHNPESMATKLVLSAELMFDFVQKRQVGSHIVTVIRTNELSISKQNRAIIQIATDDMPFIVDSITQLLVEREIEIFDFFHPVLNIKRDKNGQIISLDSTHQNSDGLPESFVHIHIADLGSDAQSESLAQEIKNILSDVKTATSQWQVMMRKLDNIIAELSSEPAPIDHNTRQEAVSFLRWLGADNFTFLGYREYKFSDNEVETIAKSGLGLFKDEQYVVLKHDGDYVDSFPELQKLSTTNTPVTILKTNKKSIVHRRTHMDQVFIVSYENGVVSGLHSFIGLFTSSAYNMGVKNVPLLSRKINAILERAGFRQNGHDGKLLTHILDTYPRDELFQADTDTLFDISMGILWLDQRPAIRVFPRHDLFNRFVTCLVYIPREKLNTDTRTKIGELLADAYGGRISTFSIWFSEANYIRIKYIISVSPSSLKIPDITELEKKVKQITTDWKDGFKEYFNSFSQNRSLINIAPVKDISNGFSVSYQAFYPPKQGVEDIAQLVKFNDNRKIVTHITQRESSSLTYFRIFNSEGAALALSDCLPIFENLGFRILTEHPFDITFLKKNIHIQEFGMQYLGSGDPLTCSESISDAFIDIYNGHIENDKLNNLIIASKLSPRQVVVLRALANYLRQTNIAYSQQKIAECLITHANITKLLWDLFDCLHNPNNHNASQETTVIQIEEAINQALTQVTVLDDDNIIRRYVNLIKSILRTNHYLTKDYVSFKLNCQQLDNLPLPVPFREIWVYSPKVEGVHLRFGKVARGGLRWSDRREDFRTEVLGLVKAQQVKNSVIVPVGAKGGFFAKQLPNPAIDRDAWLNEGISAYKIFISGLLDITDNIISNEIIPPAQVVRRDEDDPYLVVAADKGTATFSDIANSLSVERNFWLGDAFASGGSNGYDHKKMGITAKGAWEAVKRHFREMGKDIQSQEFTVSGVGDMSGDVFGNGMLLSRKIRLLAAFDHRHIFIDPNPETEKSFVERERLFNLPRSSWEDYDKSLISQGGGVFSRTLKEITLTPEIQNLLKTKLVKIRPNELIRLILQLDTELLWFGGIGTYVRANHETDTQVGDKSNDALRVTSSDIKAKVIGEGANLGLTQSARIALSMAGVALNTDAVDNSAGVDCSDHEVNIKIALGIEQDAGRITLEERNILLQKMTDEVSDLVLQTNYNQTLALSLTFSNAQTSVDLHARLIDYLEKHGNLNRAVENLPDNKSLLAGRNGFKGLTRPELAVVMAYVKLKLFDEILCTTIPDEPMFDEIVKDYMPQPLDDMADALKNHRLRREIITTVITNRAINEGGVSFIYRLCERLNISSEHAIRAYIAARRMMDFGQLIHSVNQLDNKIPYDIQRELYLILRRSLFDQARLIAIRHNEGFDIFGVVNTYKQDFLTLLSSVENNLSDDLTKQFSEFGQTFKDANVPQKIVAPIASLHFLKNSGDIIDISRECCKDLVETFQVYSYVIQILDIDDIRRKATEIPLADIYDQMALSQIISDMDIATKELIVKIITSNLNPEEWFKQNSQKMDKFKEKLADAISVNQIGLSRLSIITGALRQLFAE